MKVTIKGKEIELKNSIRAYMIYENVEGKSFTFSSVSDLVTFFYCTIVSSSKDYSITLDEVIDEIDKNPNLIQEFSTWLESSITNQNKLKKD